MIFIWLFSWVAAFLLVGVNYLPSYIQLQGGDDMLIFSLILMGTTPWMIYIISLIRSQIAINYSFGTFSAIIGYIMAGMIIGGLLIFGLSFSQSLVLCCCFLFIYFPIESRLFFVGALGSLVTVIASLILNISFLAESASIVLYYLLILGIISEAISGFMISWHRKSRKIFTFSPTFVQEYKQSIREYTWFFSYIIGIAFVLLIGMQSIGYYIQYDTLPFFVFGFWVLFGITLLTRPNIHTVSDIFREDIAIFNRWFTTNNQAFIFIALCIALSIDIIFLVRLPFWMQGTFMSISFLIIFLFQYILFKFDASKLSNFYFK